MSIGFAYVWFYKGIVQFDLIGPYIPVPKSVDSNVKKEFFMLCLKKILCGFP